MVPAEIARMWAAQIGPLSGIGAQVGVPTTYVKPHDALGNLSAGDRDIADGIVASVQKNDPNLAILAISATQSEHAARVTNAVLGNPLGSTAIETLLGGLRLHSKEGAIICHSWR